MIRCRKCGRQLRDPGSQILGVGPSCRGDHHKSNGRRQSPGNADQPGLFDEPMTIQEAMKGGPWENLDDVVDWDRLRGRVADFQKAE